MTAPAEAAVAPEAPTTPVTADAAEALVRQLDAERAEVAAEHQALSRRITPQPDRELDLALRENTAKGLMLDERRGEAKRTAKKLRDKETSRSQWRAAFAVADEHRTICESIVASCDALLAALEVELQLHETLRSAAGASKLASMNADLERLRRLRTSAAIVAERPRNGGGAHDPR